MEYDNHSWDKAIEHFRNTDPVLAQIYEQIVKQQLALHNIEAQPKELYFDHLIGSIIGQQLSLKAADTIEARLKTLMGCTRFEPSLILSIGTVSMRRAGLSYSKITYCNNVAQAVVDGSLHIHTFDRMSDEQVLQELTRIKGIGPWTAEMFLMFTLGRPNIWSFGDGGLKRAYQAVYAKALSHRDPLVLEHIENAFSPYKTYVARILWKSLELQV